MLFVLRKFYADKKRWFEKYPVIVIYLIYLVVIKFALRANHRLNTIICPHCELLFISSRSNDGRKDIFCPLGCRQANKKTKACERSKKYYSNPVNRRKKQLLNRARSLVNYVAKDLPPPKVDPFVIYLKIILQSVLLVKFKTPEIVVIINKVRSRGLLFFQKLVHYSDYG